MNIQPLAFIQNLRAPELILIFLVVLLLFGAKRLPELFKSFGKSIKEFKKATADIENDVRNAMMPTTSLRLAQLQKTSKPAPEVRLRTLKQTRPNRKKTTHNYPNRNFSLRCILTNAPFLYSLLKV